MKAKDVLDTENSRKLSKAFESNQRQRNNGAVN